MLNEKYDLGALYGYALEICENVGILDDLGEGCWGNIHITEKKMTGKFGFCRVKRDYFGEADFTIMINSALLDIRNPFDTVMNTVLHEMLHTIAGCMNHGEKWKRYAARIEKEYPEYHITRTASYKAEGVCAESIAQMTVQKKYAVVCEKCGKICKRYSRKTGAAKNPERYTHSMCGGKLRLEYLI